MKKGVNIIDKHVEKLVLAIAGLLVLAVLAMQFLSQPNAIEVNGSKVSPGEATSAVADLAERKRGEMRSATGVIDGVPSVLPFGDELIARAEGSSSGDWLTALGDRPASGDRIALGESDTSQGGSDLSSDSMYEVPAVPAPIVTAAVRYEGTIDPAVPILYESAAQYLTDQQPHDKFFVSVEGVFNAQAWREAIDAVAPENAMPLSWTSEVELLEVVLWREELAIDGTWGDAQPIPALPGRFSMRERLEKEGVLPFELQQIEADEISFRDEIRRPAFYNMIAGELWSAPSSNAVLAGDSETQAELEQLLSDLRRLDGRISGVQRSIDRFEDEYGDEWRDQDPDRGGRGGGGGDRSSLELPESLDSVIWPHIGRDWLAQIGGSSRRNNNDPSQAEVNRYRSQLQRLADLNEQRDSIIEELSDLGFDESGSAVGSDSQDVFENLSIGDEDAEDIVVWAHDITAQPGKAYRYSFVARVTSPLFANRNSLSEAQRPEAEKPFIESERSDWSRAVVVPEPTVFFVEGARPLRTSPLGSVVDASMTVNAYAFYYGYWRGGEHAFRVGDRVDFEVDLPALPIFTLESGDLESLEVTNEEMMDERALQFTSSIYVLDILLDSAVDSAIVYLRDALGISRRTPESDTEVSFRDLIEESNRLSVDAEIRQPLSEGGLGGGSGDGDDRRPPGGDGDRDEGGSGGFGGGGFGGG